MPIAQANGYAASTPAYAKIAYLSAPQEVPLGCAPQSTLKPNQIIHRQHEFAAGNPLQRCPDDIDAIVEAAV